MFIILAILGLSVLVFFHELGHFIASKIFKIKVEEFGLGYPPRICGWIRAKRKIGWLKYLWICLRSLLEKLRILKGQGRLPSREASRVKFFWGEKHFETNNETIYSLNWIPFGGFNKLKGEMGEKEGPDAFWTQVWWKKALVGIGGILMNLLLAIFIFSLCFSVGIPQALDGSPLKGEIRREIGIQIGMVASDSPAGESGLKAGDVIVSVDDQEFKEVDEIQNYIKVKVGESLKIKVKRHEEFIEKEIKVLAAKEVFKDLEESYGVIGIILAKTGIVAYSFPRAIFEGVRTTFSLAGQLFYGLWLILKTLVAEQKMLGEFFGPLGITMMAGEMAQIGFVYFLQFVGFLSVAIGVFQIIPFPALDGSRVLFALIEGVRGRPLGRKTEAITITIGFYILLLLLVFITYRELIRLAGKFFK